MDLLENETGVGMPNNFIDNMLGVHDTDEGPVIYLILFEDVEAFIV